MANKKNRSRNGKSYNRKEVDQQQLLAMFARELTRLTTHNPNNSSSKKSYSYSIYTKENILQWLQSPATSEKNLRNASNYMYLSSMHYNRLLNYYAGLYVGAYVISPLSFNKKDIKDNFAKQFKKVCDAIELMNIPKLVREETLIALRDGVFYGLLLSDRNSAFIQQIDPDYCQITAICDGTYIYKVDMTKVANKLEFYPVEFAEMYRKYLETGDKWQEVPLEISVCIKADSSLADYAIPPFAAVMPSLYTIANTESLQETATELRNYKMLAGKIPVDDKGRPLLPDDIVNRYYRHMANALGDNVGLAFTPFDLTPFSFENKTGVTDVDDVSKTVANFWSTAGTSGLLHGRENDTAGVTKLAIKNDETYVWGIIQQIEKVLNRYLKVGFSGSTKFKISILPITVFNQEEKLQYYKEAATLGLAKSYYAAALGIPQYDIAGLNQLEKELVPFDELKPLKSTYTTASNDGAGRPKSNDGDLTSSGEDTRDNDTNANR